MRSLVQIKLFALAYINSHKRSDSQVSDLLFFPIQFTYYVDISQNTYVFGFNMGKRYTRYCNFQYSILKIMKGNKSNDSTTK